MKQFPDRRATLRIVATYATFATLWIYLSDHTLGLLVQDRKTIVDVAVYKGFFFILVTALLLYQLIYRYLLHIRKTEDELLVNRKLLTSLIQGTTDAIYVKDLQGRYLQFNAAAEFVTGKPAKMVLGNDDTLIFPAGEARTIMEGDRRVMEEGRVMTFEELLTTAGGTCRTFLSTRGPIHDAAGKISGLFGIARDISERKNAELERFTYMVSHDLKSPLITIRTFLAYLEQDIENGNAEQIRKDIHHMAVAAKKMGLMLEDLLELSRVGQVSSQPVSVACGEVIDEALNMVAGPISERGVKVVAHIPDLMLFGDRPRLVEIWQNLVENACKFMGNQASPVIEIGAESQGGETVFFVRDNGIGIDPRYQEKIFGLFEKLDREVEGSGLGLALVKRIVELNGGTIRVESLGRGKGACFRFTLPGAVKDNLGGPDGGTKTADLGR